MFRCMTTFALCFMMSETHGSGTFPKCRALLDYQTHPRPHIWECPHHRALPYKRIPFTTMMTPMSYLWDGIWTDRKGYLQFPGTG